MKEKTDKRVIKTREKLISAFKVLTESKPIDDITVNEICDKADVRRATFYKHYTDKYDFFRFFVSTIRVNFENVVWGDRKRITDLDYFLEYAECLVDYFAENRALVKSICKSEIGANLLEIATHHNYLETKSRMQKAFDDGEEFCASVETISMMLVGGMARTLLSWACNDMPMSSEQLKEELCSIIKALKK